VSVSTSVSFGILALFTGDFGELHGEILLSEHKFSTAGVISLAVVQPKSLDIV